MLFKNTKSGLSNRNRLLIPLQGVNSDKLINEINTNPNNSQHHQTNNLPVVGGWSVCFVRTPEMQDSVKISDYIADPEYLKTLGLDLISGRNFANKDLIGNEKYIIINQTALEKFKLGNEVEAIGKTLYVEGSPKEIIGVVKDYYTRTPIEPIQAIILRFIPKYASELIVQYYPEKKTK